MTDKKLQLLINNTIKHKLIFFNFLDELEREYEVRFGFNPSDVDDDSFIDVFHMRQGCEMTVKEMTEQAITCKK